MITKNTWIVALLAVTIFSGGVIAQDEKKADPKVQKFDQLLGQIQKDPGAVNDAQVRELLSLSKELGRAYSTNLAIKGYLARSLSPAPELLVLAADNAMLAGDYRTAVARYKSYLGKARPSQQSSEAAANLFAILVDHINATDDAYESMKKWGDEHRASPRIRKFDTWFMQQGTSRKDYPALAKRAATVLAQKMPIEQERYYFWHSIDWTFRALSRGEQGMFDALKDAERAAKLIREDPIRQKEYELYVAKLNYNANYVASEKDAMATAFGKVVDAAKAYFNAAKSVEAVKNIHTTFCGGHDTANGRDLNEHHGQKHKFWGEVLSQLNHEQQVEALSFNSRGYWLYQYFASPEGQLAFLEKNPKLIKDLPTIRSFQGIYNTSPDPEMHKKQAAVMKDVESVYAAISRSLAAGESLDDAINHYMANESWMFDFTEPYSHIRSYIWSRFSQFKREGTSYQQSIYNFGKTHVAQSPIALFETNAASDYILYTWRYSGKDGDDKSKVAEALQSLDWVPYDAKTRTKVFSAAYEEFKRWTDGLRKKHDKDPKSVASDVMAQISPLETAFKKAMNAAVTDPKKAPNELCKLTAEMIIAQNEGRAKEYIAAAEKLYASVKDWHTKKTPLGRGYIWMLMQPGPQGAEDTKLHCKILADNIAGWPENDAEAWHAEWVANAVMSSRPGWRWGGTPKGDQKEVLQFSEVFGNELKAMAAKDKFSKPLFYRWRHTRYGSGWNQWSHGLDVARALFEKQLLAKNKHTFVYGSGAASSMWFVYNRAQDLAKEFPPNTAFDDAYLEEHKDDPSYDWNYWSYGHDKDKKIVNTVAKQFADFKVVPFGFGKTERLYNPNDFGNWQSRVLGADDAIVNDMIGKIEATYGKTRFDEWAMGRAFFAEQASVKTEEDVTEFFKRLKLYVDRAEVQPDQVNLPYFNQWQNIDASKLTEEQVNTLVRMMAVAAPDHWHRGWYFENYAELTLNALKDRQQYAQMLPLAPEVWRIAKIAQNATFLRTMAKFSRELINDTDDENGKKEDAQTNPAAADVATVYAVIGLEMLGTELPEDVRTSLLSVKSKALSEIGGVIPVSRGDARWPIFKSQADFLAGRTAEAWDQYLSRQDMVKTMLKDLDPNYVIWLIEQNASTKRFDIAEELGQEMIAWTESTPSGFEPEVRASLGVAFAGISYAQQEYPRARAWLNRIATAREFDGTRSQQMAELRIAEVDRVTKQYEAAVSRLETLTRSRDRSLQADAYYQLALVNFDQEEFLESRDRLNEVFARTPGHAAARILQGQLNIKLRNLEEAREVAVGLSSDKRFIVPGRPLKVALEDRNLAIVKGGANIEIRAWTDSGDEEFFSLFPKGDSKTKFEGQINTTLAPVKKGDRALQLIGSDTVYYNFSPRFMAQREDSEEFAPTSLTVVTDGELYVSSGRILTPEEQEEKALEKLVKQRLRLNADHLQRMVLDTDRADDQIKPGNKINVRLIDPDQSLTGKVDKVRINVTTSSGDRVNGFEVVETETHSGVFEGSIPTSTGQATAYASDSEEGRDPNFAISSNDFPEWVGLADNRRPKTFSVDLNDNVQLGKMTVVADTVGRKLKDFLVQTSINGRDFNTVGRWPAEHVPWDGSLRLELVKYVRGTIPLRTIDDYKDYLEKEYLSAGAPKVVLEPSKLAASWNRDIGGHAGKMQIGWSDWYLARFYGAFEVKRSGVRTFKIEDNDRDKNIRYFLLIDGKPSDRDPDTVTRSLSKGVHRIDLIVYAYRHANPKFTVLCDTEDSMLQPCPPSMFDPKEHPAVKEAVYIEPAKVVANEAKTQFDIEFAKDANGRVVRLILADFETDAPAISKIKLTDRADRVILPTKEDFTKLKQNNVLEIVPGDRITISYEDPKVIDQAKKSLSAFMSATFSNAELSACFVEYDLDSRGDRVAEYIPMRRFKPGDAIQVFVNDPDADVSDNQDVIEVTARTESSKTIKIKAMETNEHSGIFVGTVLPVSEAPQTEGEIQVKPGEDVKLGYFDQENTDPGVPFYRNFSVEQAMDDAPEMRIYNLTSTPIDEAQQLRSQEQESTLSGRRINEYIPATRNIIATRPTEPLNGGQPASVFVDGPYIVEIVHPAVARSPNSQASIYVQTSAARELYGQDIPEGVYDVNVPGTIKLSARPVEQQRIEVPEGYQRLIYEGTETQASPLEEGRFTFRLPVEMGTVPEQTLIYEDEELARDVERTPLYIQGNDEVYVGYEYQTPDGGTKWVTQTIKLTGDVMFHAMDRRYQELIEGLHVGETAYFRIINKPLDSTEDKDTLSIQLQTASGKQATVELFETYGHSGIFKGFVRLVFAGEEGEPESTELQVVYGDVITATYTPTGGQAMTQKIEVFKGSDGDVLPFTKRFKDPAIAVETQFTIAEAFFELAKRHRDLGKESLARREIAQGKKLLEEAIRDFPDTAAQAQANYLLANLAFEFAKDAKNEQIEKEYYVEAINRFSDIVSSYPDSPYAPKSQYKKALVLEKMGDIDGACEEYVKLSYRYPENELVAETIARLGNYFLTKGREFNDRASETEDVVEREKIKLQGFNMFTTAAEVFGRLGKRFPNHRLSGKTAVLSAQCYMLAEKFDKAVEGFKAVYTNTETDNDLAAESMYWCGDCHMKANQLEDAYQVFKKLTWDYPESKWAKYARGRLTDDALLRVAEQDADN